MLGYSVESTDGRLLGSDKGIILRYIDGRVIVYNFEYVDGITFGLGVGKDLGSLDGSFDGCNDCSLVEFLL